MIRRSLTSRGLPAALLLLLLAAPAGLQAATVRAMSLEEHVSLSVSVLRGRVLSSVGVVREGRSFTETTIEVIDTLKGRRAPGELVRIHQLGGSMGESNLQVPGDAVFELGEEAIVFLHVDETEASYLSALAFSKFSVERSEAGPLVSRELGSLRLYLGEPGARGVEIQDIDVPVSLPLFEAAVRDLSQPQP